MNADTTLLRQIHPQFVQQGRVTSQAFRPTPKDELKLSVYDGDLIEPKSAFEHYTQTLCQASVGTQAATVAECESLNLTATSDPEPFPEHVVIDFAGFSKSDVEKKAKLLRVMAEQRGWLHGPTTSL